MTLYITMDLQKVSEKLSSRKYVLSLRNLTQIRIIHPIKFDIYGAMK